MCLLMVCAGSGCILSVFLLPGMMLLAGFIIFGTRDDGAAPYGVIYDLGVLPELRKKGTGSLLVRTALDALREQGVEACYLESGVNNHSAHHFFEQFGFRQVSCVFRNKL